jgi:tetratricopeptide (TPR) repeat protein
LYSKFIIILYFINLCSCDFRSQLHKEILTAQKLLEQKKYKEAVVIYKRSLKKNPQLKIRDKIYNQISEINLIYLNKPLVSKKFFYKIINESSNLDSIVNALVKIADINFSVINNYKEAVNNYEKLLLFQPRLKNYEFFQFRLSNSYTFDYQNEKAEKLLKKIIKKKNHKYYVDSLSLIGLNSFQSKKWEQAIYYWEEYLKYEENINNIVEIKYLIANCYETQENLKKAYDLYYSILGEHPNTEMIQNRLESIYSRKVARKR